MRNKFTTQATPNVRTDVTRMANTSSAQTGHEHKSTSELLREVDQHETLTALEIELSRRMKGSRHG